MNSSNSSWRYDLFKLFVALVLLIVLLQSHSNTAPIHLGSGNVDDETVTPETVPQADDQEPTAPEISEEPELPPVPASPVTLSLDGTRHYLLTPDGYPVYVLDDENWQWIPVIPDEIIAGLKDGYTLVQSESEGWIILSDGGKALYSWDQETQTWNALQQSGSDEDCPVVLSPHLQAGGKARVLVNLNMRSSPGIKDNWMLTNTAQTELRILSGPVCVVQEGGAYWWWEVENPSGLRGWSAEAHQGGLYYFLEPVSP
jgi:hypothetical protein